MKHILTLLPLSVLFCLPAAEIFAQSACTCPNGRPAGQSPILNLPGTQPVRVTCWDDLLGVLSDPQNQYFMSSFDPQDNAMAPLCILTAAPANSCLKTLSVMVDAQDNDGHCAQNGPVTITVIIDDKTPPVITLCPAAVDISCSESLDPTVNTNLGIPEYEDGCAGDVTVAYLDMTVSSNCATDYVIDRTWTVGDACGNTASCVQSITVTDDAPPTFNAPPDHATVAVDGDCDFDASVSITGEPTNLNDCDPSPDIDLVEVSSFSNCGLPVITRTWTISDACGNSTAFVQTVEAVDLIPPVIQSCPPNTTVECDMVPDIPELQAEDNCQSAFPVSGTEMTGEDPDFPNFCDDYYSLLRTWVAEDNCGNTSSCTQLVIVRDMTDPDITCPADVVVSCEESLDPSNTGEPDGMDNCTTPIDLSHFSSVDATVSTTCPDGYTIHRTWTLTDDCQNSSSCTQVITVQDLTAPGIICPADAAVSCDEDKTPVALGEADATDNCDAAPVVTHADNTVPGSCTGNYVITRTWSAEDACGNSSSCEQVITVTDTDAPDFVMLPADTVMQCGDDPMVRLAAWEAHYGGATATDNCGPLTWDTEVTGPTDECGETGVYNLTVTVEDDCGNPTVATATFTLDDSTPPTIGCSQNDLNDTHECSGAGNETAASAWDQANILALVGCSSDACSDVTPLAVASDYDFANLTNGCGNTGTLTVTYTVTDNCGNSSTITGVFTIEDNVAPDLSACPTSLDETIECDGAANNASDAQTWNQDNINTLTGCATDVCADVTVTSDFDYNNLSDGCGETGALTVTYTVSDGCNSSTATATFTVVDITPPSLLSCTQDLDLAVECGSASANEAAADDWNADNIGYLEGCALDACSDVTVTSDYDFDDLSNGCGLTGSLTVTYMVTDACGLSATTTATFTVEDTQAPQFTKLPLDYLFGCQFGDPQTELNLWRTLRAGAQASDACGPVTWNTDLSPLMDGCGETGTYTLTVTIEDECGNSDSETADFVIIDQIAPSLAGCTPSDLDETHPCSGAGNQTAAEAWNEANIDLLETCATDACSDEPLVVTSDFDFNDLSNGCGNTGALTVTYTVTDNCGNASTITGTFTIEDNTAPDLSGCTASLDETFECAGPTDNASAAEAWDQGNIADLTFCAMDACTDVTVTSDFDYASLVGGCGETGVLTVTYTVTDGCNSSTATATFTVEDTQAPSLVNCTQDRDLTVECGTATVNETAADDWNADNIAYLEGCAEDICGSVTATSDYDFGNLSDGCGLTGTMTVTYSVTDECGNSSTTTATFTVEDTASPVFTSGPNDETVECGPLVPTQLGQWLASSAGAMASDPCSGVTIANVGFQQVLGCGDTKVVTITVRATDACGNQANEPVTFTVEDNTPPVIGCSPSALDMMHECTGMGNEAAAEAWDAANIAALEGCSTDDCSDEPLAVSSDFDWANLQAGACGGAGSLTVTYTVTDDCGNMSTITGTFTIEDNTAPDLSGCMDAPEDATIECMGASNNESVAEIWDQANITDLTLCALDACVDVTVTSDFDYANLDGSCGETGVLTVTYNVTDGCNSSTATATFTVEDTEAPSLVNCMQDMDLTVECGSATANETAADDWNTDNIAYLEGCAEDVCGNVMVTSDYNYSNLSDGCGETGSLTVTYTVTDECNNSTTTTATFTVEDTAPPVFTSGPNDETVECGPGVPAQLGQWLATNAGAVAEDACSMVTIANVGFQQDFGCGDTKVVTITVRATDACGNQANEPVTFTVEDNTPPAIGCSPSALDMMHECTGLGNETAAEAWDAANIAALEGCSTDDCSDEPLAVSSDFDWANLQAGNCGGEGTLPVTYTVTDDCGNMSTITGTFTIEDNTAPDLSGCTASLDETIECVGATNNASAAATWDQANIAALTACAMDACTDVTVTSDFNYANLDGSCGETGVLTVTYTVTDGCNSTTTTATFTVEDVTSPSLVACMLDLDLTVECASVSANETAANTWNADNIADLQSCAADVCGDVTVTSNYNYGNLSDGCGETGSLTVTYTVTDECNNSTTTTATFTVEDTGEPTWSQGMPVDVTVQCHSIPAAASPILATDACSGSATVSFLETSSVGACDDNYTISRTWTATDACGNSTSHLQTISVEDTQAPTWSQVMPADVTVQCHAVPAAPSMIAASDLCDSDVSVSFAENSTDGSCPDAYFLTRTWTAEDDCGNKTTHTQTITVQDTQAPTWSQSMPTDLTVECHAVPAPVTPIMASDLCDLSVSVTYDQVQTAGNCPDSYMLSRAWTAEDNCGNKTTHTQTITVRDTQAPTWSQSMPVNVTVECSAVPAPASPILASDLCDMDVSVSFGEARTDGNCPDNYTLTRTWTATDNCGNALTHSQVITVRDTQVPVWDQTMPVNVTVECSNIPLPPATTTATDLCDLSVTVAYGQTNTAGSCPDNYTLTRTWTATDNCGNAITHTQTVTVQDTQAPIWNQAMPSDVTVDCHAVPPPPTPVTANDNCDVSVNVNYAQVQSADICTDSYTLTRTWTAEDNCGNKTTHTQTITVRDMQAPSWSQSMPGDATVECHLLPAVPSPITATDLCDLSVSVTFDQMQTAGSCPDSYMLTRTWTAEDNCGNKTTHTQTITVQDTQAPTWSQSMPADLTIDCNAVPMVPPAIAASDACDMDVSVSFTEVRTDGNCPDSYTLTRTWTATDNCGNKTTHTQTISVLDTQVPAWSQSMPVNVTVECNAVPAPASPIQATDNCDLSVAISYGQVRTDGNCSDNYILTRTWTAEDNCGNVITHTQTIVVQDTQAPTWSQSMPVDLTVECHTVPTPASPINALDNCDPSVTVSFTQSQTAGSCPDSYTLTRTWTAEDNCGNQTTHTQTITVRDTQAPTWSQSMPGNVTVECSAVPAPASPILASDLCDMDVSVSYGQVRTDGACPDNYTLTRTWIAEDNCGNKTTHTQTITVRDTQAPTWDQNMPVNVTVECSNVPLPPATTTASDLCDVSVTVTYGQINTAGSCPDSYTLTRTWTATDNCGNAITHTQTITVQDTQAPTWNQAMPSDVTVECHAVPTPLTPVTANDNCDAAVNVSYAQVQAAGSCPDSYTLTRTWTAEDNCGNKTTHTQTITVQDTQAPTWNQAMPSNVTVECNAVPAVPSPITASDLCDLSVSVTYNQVQTAGSCPDSYTLTRTWTAEDNCGNKASHTQTITVRDTQAPTWNQSMPSDVTVECNAVPAVPSPITASDLCDVSVSVTYGQTNTAGSCPDSYTLTRTWTAEDNCGNKTTHTQTITVRDTQAPTWNQSMPTNLTVECHAVPAPASPITATDLCDVSVSITYNQVQTAGNCPDSYTVTRTWTAEDNCGNKATHTQTITVRDTQAPTWSQSMPINLTVECHAVPAPAAPINATDLCDLSVSVTYNQVQTAGSCPDSYTLTRTWTAEDNCGNKTTHTQTITVRDTQAPTWSQSMPMNATVECHAVPAPASPILASDLCDLSVSVSYTQIRTDGACPDYYTLTRTWTAEDDCGNKTTHTQTITVRDTQAPTWSQSMPVNVTVECGNIPLPPANIAATDLCDVSVTVAYSQNSTPGSCPDSYTLTRAWTATDNCGNAITHTQTITVRDTQAPTWNQSMPAHVTVECHAVPAPLSPVSASDNCDASVNVTYNQVQTAGSCPDSYTLTRTWIAEDNCGNKTTHTQTITVRDTQAPTWNQSMPANVTVECHAVPVVPSPITASDLCDLSVSVTYNQVQTAGSCPDSYTLTRTWTAEDNCGNKTTHTQTITVRDTQAPTWNQSMPAHVTVECNAVPAVPSPITASDLCDLSVSVTYEQVQTAGNCPDSYTLTRTWTAEDNCGNKTTHVQTITVRDTQVPVWSQSMPVNLTVECNAVPAPAAPVAATDNCDMSVSVSYTQVRTDGNCPDTYTLTRTWTATDNCANAITHTQVITVRDTQVPVWSQAMPSNVTVECSAVPVVPTIAASDNCDASVGVTYIQVRTDGNCPDSYTLTRTWTATDNCANAITHTQVITVRDTQVPMWSQVMPSNVTVECNAVPAPASPVNATDNCDASVAVSFTEIRTNGSCPDTYTLTRTWTATDNCANAITHTQIVTVRDTQVPVWSQPMPANVTVECSAVPVVPGILATDNCDTSVTVTFTEIRTNGSCEDTYTLTRTWTATDNCGNTITHTQTITVRDTQAPTLSCKPFTAYLAPNGTVTIQPQDVLASVSDNCDMIVSLGLSKTSFNCSNVGPNTVILTATDNCANASQCSAVVTVLDTVPPNAICQNVTIFLDNNGLASTTAAAVNNGSNDACGIASLVLSRTQFFCADLGDVAVTLTVTDVNGNVSTCGAFVQVRDVIPPTVQCKTATIDLNAQGQATLFAFQVESGSSDNCQVFPLSVVPSQYACAQVGLNTVTYTVSDAAGNTASCLTTVLVRDLIPPTLSCKDITVEIGPQGNPVSITVSAVTNTASDNCGLASLTIAKSSFGCDDAGVNLVFVEAIDPSGNQNSCIARVTVRDNIPPFWTYQPGDTTVYCSEKSATEFPLAEDNCGNVQIVLVSETQELWPGGPKDGYRVRRIWSATDPSYNVIQYTQLVYVIVDGDFLTFCNQDIITQVTNIPIRVDWSAPYIDDICVGKVDMAQIGGPAPNSFFNPGSKTIITYEYVDSYGIRYQCSFWVTVPAETTGYLLTFNEQDCAERQLTSCQVKDLPAPDNYSLEWIQPGMSPVILDLDLSGSFETFADGTARLQGGWTDALNVCGWDVDIRLHRRRTYNGWTAAGGLVSNALSVANPQTWNFFEVDGSASIVTGTGCNAGKQYAVTISPNFPKFGFQLGNGANQKTTPNGGWMVVGIRDLADGSLVAQGIFSFELTCQNTNRIKDAATVVSLDGFNYPVSWSNGKTGYALGDVGPGTYSVTITDQGGIDSIVTFPVSLPTGCILYYENECRPVSVAIDGKAKQSGTLGGADAGRAIDDNTDGNLANGSVSNTPNGGRNWWTLDLIKPADVAFLRLWNRTDCCGEVLDPFWVFVSEYPIPNDADPDSVLLLPGVTTFYHEGPVDTFVDLAFSGLARYVKVQLDQFGSLALAEVQVLVCQPDEVGIDTDAFTVGGEESSSAAKAPEADEVPQLTPWPNPVDELLQLTVEQGTAHEVTVTVMNLLGAEMYRTELPAAKFHQFTVDTGSWSPGTYFVTVTSPVGASSRQVTVQR